MFASMATRIKDFQLILKSLKLRAIVIAQTIVTDYLSTLPV